MFGKHWTPARGTVVARRGRTSGSGDTTTYDFVVDVTTETGEVFRSQVDEPHIATNFRDPSIGETVGVEYDPESRKVRFDKDDPALSWKKWKETRDDTFDAALAAPAGTPAARVALPGMTGAVGPDMSQLQALLQAQGIQGLAGLTDAHVSVRPQVIQLTPGSPEADALRQALLQAFGAGATQPPADPAPQDGGAH